MAEDVYDEILRKFSDRKMGMILDAQICNTGVTSDGDSILQILRMLIATQVISIKDEDLCRVATESGLDEKRIATFKAYQNWLKGKVIWDTLEAIMYTCE